MAEGERQVIEQSVFLGEGRDGTRTMVVATAASVQSVQGTDVLVAIGQSMGSAPLGTRCYDQLADSPFRANQ